LKLTGGCTSRFIYLSIVFSVVEFIISGVAWKKKKRATYNTKPLNYYLPPKAELSSEKYITESVEKT